MGRDQAETLDEKHQRWLEAMQHRVGSLGAAVSFRAVAASFGACWSAGCPERVPV
ncbi:hypothetical protein OG894_44995 (plasmid) [Streptomyces sp. NBC_01724]|uniref:hypothetical protein n=1 Tax=Streptomyces sp. NBC_01724 TaxID=2975922 RepID=UPI002E373322|nr:hypothetical protein [Streptomyces sp. NBC_01724]